MKDPETFSEAIRNLKYWIAVLVVEILLAAWPTVYLMKRKEALRELEKFHS